MNHSGIRYCFQLWKAKESIVFFVLLSYLSIPSALYAATGANARSTVNPNDMNLNTPPAIAGNIPQDVTERAGKNAVFIVYGLKETPRTADRIKDLCANFSAMIRSIRNRFPDMQFSCTMGFGADAWSRLFPERPKPRELETFQEIKGARHTAVSTPGDLFFHIRGR